MSSSNAKNPSNCGTDTHSASHSRNVSAALPEGTERPDNGGIVPGSGLTADTQSPISEKDLQLPAVEAPPCAPETPLAKPNRGQTQAEWVPPWEREVPPEPQPLPPGVDTLAPQIEPGSPAGDYRVGFGKPPLNTRFQKGQSGNPSGRPAGRKKIREFIVQEAARLVFQQGELDIEEVPVIHAILRAECELAMKGNGPAQRHFIKLVLEAEKQEVEAEKKRNEVGQESKARDDGQPEKEYASDVSIYEEALKKDFGPYWSGKVRAGRATLAPKGRGLADTDHDGDEAD